MIRAPRNPSPKAPPPEAVLPPAEALTQARRRAADAHRAASEAVDRIARALQNGEKLASADIEALRPFAA